jgi:uncharacterized protein (DUF433 family)
MDAKITWKYLVRKPRSAYKQLFVKDRWVAARTLYGQTVGDDARTPEELARDYDLPFEAVKEAIAYCESNPPEIREDWEQEESSIRSRPRDEAAEIGISPDAFLSQSHSGTNS